MSRAFSNLLFMVAAWAGVVAPCNADTLRLAIPNPPLGRGNPYQSPGPANTIVAPAIFDALTVIDGEGGLHPGLALSWSSDSEARVWTFRLRPDVRFSNGAPFSAAAVVAALNYLTKAPSPADLVALEFSDIAGYRAVDPLTLEITARRAMPLLPRVASVLFVVEPETWRALGPQGFGGAPVGTGPFQVKSWGPAGITLDAFAGSWRAPKMTGLDIVFQQDATSRVQGLLAGTFDIALALAVEDRPALAGAGARLLAVPIPAVTALMFLSGKPGAPFADARVRQAMNFAVDRERIARVLFDGAVPVATQPVARTVLGFDPALLPYAYDPSRARALLAEAGRGDGFSVTLEAVVGSSGADGTAYELIAQDLAAIKVRMTVKSLPAIRFNQVFRGGTWQGDAFAFIYGAEPAFDGIRALKYYTCGWRPRMYCDPDAEPLIAAAEDAVTLEDRAAIARRVVARYREQASGLFLYESPRFHGVSGRLKGFKMDNARIAFEDITLTP